MLLGLKYDLIIHLGLSVTIAILLLLNYADFPDTKVFSLDLVLNSASSVFAISNAALSLLNLVVELMSRPSDGWNLLGLVGGSNEKIKLENEKLNYARNFLTASSLVLLGIQHGQHSSDRLLACVVCTAILRFSDLCLDVENVLQIQCEGYEKAIESGIGKNMSMRSIKALMVGVLLIATIILQSIFMNNEGIDLEGKNNDDDIMLVIILSASGLHLLLILLHLILNALDLGKGFCVGCLQGSTKGANENCDNVSIHMLNEIPPVSKLVFTANLLLLAIVMGERIEDNKDIHLMVWSACLLGSADFIARNHV